MNVADLQQFLRSLAQLTSQAGGKKAADELSRAASCLEPFAARPIGEFADFLEKAERYDRTGELVPKKPDPKPRAAKQPKAPRPTVESAVEDLKRLEKEILAPGCSTEEATERLRMLDSFTKPELTKVAVALGLPASVGRLQKPAILEAIRKSILSVRDSRDRSRQ